MADPRFVLAIGISVLSGAVRGFSGFGSALIYVPLMSALYGPQIGAASYLLIDCVARGCPADRRGRGRGAVRHADPALRRPGVAALADGRRRAGGRRRARLGLALSRAPAGAKLFHLTSEQTYRRVAYVIISLAAIASMPLWVR